MSFDQLTLFEFRTPVVHFFDHNGALRTGLLVRRITRGKKQGLVVVRTANGKTCIPARIRNIDYL